MRVEHESPQVKAEGLLRRLCMMPAIEADVPTAKSPAEVPVREKAAPRLTE